MLCGNCEKNSFVFQRCLVCSTLHCIVMLTRIVSELQAAHSKQMEHSVDARNASHWTAQSVRMLFHNNKAAEEENHWEVQYGSTSWAQEVSKYVVSSKKKELFLIEMATNWESHFSFCTVFHTGRGIEAFQAAHCLHPVATLLLHSHCFALFFSNLTL